MNTIMITVIIVLLVCLTVWLVNPFRFKRLRDNQGRVIGWLTYDRRELEPVLGKETHFQEKSGSGRIEVFVEDNFYKISVKKKAKELQRRVISNVGQIRNVEEQKSKNIFTQLIRLDDLSIQQRIFDVGKRFVIVDRQSKSELSINDPSLNTLKFYLRKVTG